MNMNKLKKINFIITILISFFVINVNAFADTTCNQHHSKGKEFCEKQTYNGKKCAWDGTKKGGSRCYDSGKMANEVKEQITSCDQIEDPTTCSASKIDGHECIWRQGACYSNTLVDDGSDKTIIADDQKERDQKENNNSNIEVSGSDDVTLKKCEDIDTKEKCDVNNCKWNKGTKKCENYYVAQDPCSENSIKKVLRFFGYLLLIAKVVIPLIIIGFGTFDLFKAVTDKDEKSLGKQIKVLGIRIFTGIFVFFIPNLVYAVFGLTEKLNVIEQDKYKTCANCLLKPTSAECQIEEDTDNNSVDNSGDNSDNNTHQSSSGRTHGGTGGSY